MNLPIEILGIGSIIALVVFFSAWKFISEKILKRRYKPENDKSRLGEEKRRADLATDAAIRRIESGKADEARPGLAEKREPVPPANPDKAGQNSIGSRKSRTSIIRFRRR
jgi:hypothetical protein